MAPQRIRRTPKTTRLAPALECTTPLARTEAGFCYDTIQCHMSRYGPPKSEKNPNRHNGGLIWFISFVFARWLFLAPCCWLLLLGTALHPKTGRTSVQVSFIVARTASTSHSIVNPEPVNMGRAIHGWPETDAVMSVEFCLFAGEGQDRGCSKTVA